MSARTPISRLRPTRRPSSVSTGSIGLTTEAGFIVALVARVFSSATHSRALPKVCMTPAVPNCSSRSPSWSSGAELGVKAAAASGMAGTIIFRGLCAIVEAYLLYWAFVYYVARKYFKFSREWAVPLASGISICGVSARHRYGEFHPRPACGTHHGVLADRGVHLHRNADPALHRFPLPVQRAHGGRRAGWASR